MKSFNIAIEELLTTTDTIQEILNNMGFNQEQKKEYQKEINKKFDTLIDTMRLLSIFDGLYAESTLLDTCIPKLITLFDSLVRFLPYRKNMTESADNYDMDALYRIICSSLNCCIDRANLEYSSMITASLDSEYHIITDCYKDLVGACSEDNSKLTIDTERLYGKGIDFLTRLEEYKNNTKE